MTGKFGDYPIAIVGIGLEFPGAISNEEYFRNISQGASLISNLSVDQLGETVSLDLYNNKKYITAAGRLNEIEYFDYDFFGFDKNEAAIIDPQHRLLLQVAYKALEDACCDPDRYEGLIGVYTSVGISHYLINNLLNNKLIIETYGYDNLIFKNDKFAANSLISYKLNLKGPSLSIDTACSSSLVATHLACRGLLNHETDIALAGACRITIPHFQGEIYYEGGILSPRGICSPFDDNADGSVFGSGAAIIVLKRLNDAIRDNDFIYSVIRGSSIGNDGHEKIGYTAPSINGQKRTILAALETADMNPEKINYIECHGTGTKIGDPIEIAALGEAFNAYTDKKQFCAVGSVKANIGHLDVAAGIAGVINITNILRSSTIPPLINFTAYNSSFDWLNSPFYVNSGNQKKLAMQDGDLFGMINSLGIGGTNASLIIQNYNQPIKTRHFDNKNAFTIIKISAQRIDAIVEYKNSIKDFLKNNQNINIHDVAFSLSCRKSHFYQEYFIVNSLENLLIKLNHQPDYKIHTKLIDKSFKATFIFEQEIFNILEIFLSLYKTNTTFKLQIDLCSKLFIKYFNLDMIAMAFSLEQKSLNDNYLLSQLLTFSTQYALAKTLEEYCIKPDQLMGRGIGEFVLLCFAGICTLEDTVLLIAENLHDLNSHVHAKSHSNYLKTIKFNFPKYDCVSSLSHLVINDELLSNAYWIGKQDLSVSFSSDLNYEEEYKKTNILPINFFKFSSSIVKNEHTIFLNILLSVIQDTKSGSINKLFENNYYNKIPLPSYKFMKAHCWIEADKKNITIHNAAPEKSCINMDNKKSNEITLSEITEMLNQIWSKFFTEFNQNDQFYNLGGDSLTAMFILTELRDHFGYKGYISDFDGNSSISYFSQKIFEQLNRASLDVKTTEAGFID